MGDSISEGTIEELLKGKTDKTFHTRQGVGDFVEADDVVAVIETDKVNVEIRASKAGVLTKFFAESGDNIEVGADFFEIDPDAKGSAAPASPPPAGAPAEVSSFFKLITNQGSKKQHSTKSTRCSPSSSKEGTCSGLDTTDRRP